MTTAEKVLDRRGEAVTPVKEAAPAKIGKVWGAQFKEMLSSLKRRTEVSTVNGSAKIASEPISQLPQAEVAQPLASSAEQLAQQAEQRKYLESAYNQATLREQVHKEARERVSAESRFGLKKALGNLVTLFTENDDDIAAREDMLPKRIRADIARKVAHSEYAIAALEKQASEAQFAGAENTLAYLGNLQTEFAALAQEHKMSANTIAWERAQEQKGLEPRPDRGPVEAVTLGFIRFEDLPYPDVCRAQMDEENTQAWRDIAASNHLDDAKLTATQAHGKGLVNLEQLPHPVAIQEESLTNLPTREFIAQAPTEIAQAPAGGPVSLHRIHLKARTRVFAPARPR